MMQADKKLFKALSTSNSRLADEINQLALINDAMRNDAATKKLLSKLYNSIVRLAERRGHPPAPNKTIVEAYHGFFEPIQALSKLPMGDFLTARMCLYLASAFIHDNSLNLRFNEHKVSAAAAFLHEFCVALDDALLDPLRRIWKNRDRWEEFDWVFSEYPVQRGMQGDTACPELAQALSPEELANAGVKGRRWFWSELGDEPSWKPFIGRLPDADDEDTEKLLWKCVGTDGPIREDRLYRTLGKDACEESPRAIPVLRRSRQFITDARMLAKPLIAEEKHHLLERILFKASIPTEVREMIWRYMEEPPRAKDAYITGLNIAAAYAPFPVKPGPCIECKERELDGRDRILRYTCPEATIYVWNLSLRLFHVFHRRGRSSWWPCIEGLDCEGHHDDDTWQMQKQGGLDDWIEQVNTERNDSFTKFHDQGCNTEPSLFLDTQEADKARRDRLFSGRGPFEDAVRERKMHGGLCGLLDTMTHNQVRIGAWRGPEGSGEVMASAQWVLGRNLMEEAKAVDSIKVLMHRNVSNCRRCRGFAPRSPSPYRPHDYRHAQYRDESREASSSEREAASESDPDSDSE
ncbi:hypothetical protein ACJ41O_005897 [Fusarium nematophilum]